MPLRNGKRVNWTCTVNIKPLLERYEDPDEEQIQEVGRAIRDLFYQKGFKDWQGDFFHGALDGMAYSDDLNEFNSHLNELYDWADENFVWVGL